MAVEAPTIVCKKPPDNAISTDSNSTQPSSSAQLRRYEWNKRKSKIHDGRQTRCACMRCVNIYREKVHTYAGLLSIARDFSFKKGVAFPLQLWSEVPFKKNAARLLYTNTRPFDYVRTLVPPTQYRHWGVISTGNIIITNIRRHANTHTQRRNKTNIYGKQKRKTSNKKINDVSRPRPPRPPPPLPVHRANARSSFRILFLPPSATPAEQQQQLDKNKFGMSIRNDIYRSLVLVKYWLN